MRQWVLALFVASTPCLLAAAATDLLSPIGSLFCLSLSADHKLTQNTHTTQAAAKPLSSLWAELRACAGGCGMGYCHMHLLLPPVAWLTAGHGHVLAKSTCSFRPTAVLRPKAACHGLVPAEICWNFCVASGERFLSGCHSLDSLHQRSMQQTEV